MRKLATIFLIFSVVVISKAQDLDISGGMGTGYAFMVENADDAVQVDYSSTKTFFSEISYKKANNYFHPSLSFDFLNVNIDGENWQNSNAPLNGKVSSISTFLSLEHLKDSEKKVNLGYFFGMGYTSQSIEENYNDFQENKMDNYFSLRLGGNLQPRISDNFLLTVRPTLLWTDPINSLSNSSNWQLAGEDLSFLINFGATYQLR